MVAAFAAAAVGVTAAAFAIGAAFDESFDSIRTATGKTGEALEGLKDDFKATFGSVPDDAATVSAAIAGLAQRTGLTGESLQTLTKSVLDFSRVTGTEASANVRDLTRLFSQFGVAADDQVGTMDKLLRASQATGIGTGTLQSALVKNATTIKGLGLGFNEAAALIGNFEKEGVNTEQALAGMGKSFAKFAKDGLDSKEAFSTWVTAIRDGPDAATATAQAIELFGIKAGPELAAAIREGRFNTDELLATIAGGSETVAGAVGDTEDLAEAWAKFSNRVMVAVEPFGTAVFNLAGVIFDKLAPAFDAAVGKIAPFATALSSIVGLLSEGDPEKRIEMFNKLSEVFGPEIAESIALVSSGIIGIVGAFTGNDDGMDRFHNALIGIFGEETTGKIMEFVGLFQGVVGWIQQMAAVTQAAIAPLFGMVDGMTVLKVVAVGVGLTVVTAISAITLVIAGVATGIALLATAWKLAWDKIDEAVKFAQKTVDTFAQSFGSVNFATLVGKWKDDLVAGFNDMISAAKGKIAELANLLPHSPAKEGPLSVPVNWGFLFEGMPAAAAEATAQTSAVLAGGFSFRGSAPRAGANGPFGAGVGYSVYDVGAGGASLAGVAMGSSKNSYALGDIHVTVTPDANGNVSVDQFTRGVTSVAEQVMERMNRGLGQMSASGSWGAG